MPIVGAAHDVNGFVPYLVVNKTNMFEYFVYHIIELLHVRKIFITMGILYSRFWRVPAGLRHRAVV